MVELFKGYQLSEYKSPIGVVDEAHRLSEKPVDCDYVGILKDEFVQIDFDDDWVCEIVKQIVIDEKLQCCMLQSENGIHLYFKNEGKVKNWCS